MVYSEFEADHWSSYGICHQNRCKYNDMSVCFEFDLVVYEIMMYS
jgi:hypothetical protein